MSSDKNVQIIGRAENVTFPELGPVTTHARIDTGARTSAIWVSSVQETDKGLEVVFFGEGNDSYSGTVHIFETYGNKVVASSTGHAESRYTVKLQIIVKGRKIRATFTLANRSTQVYPVLVGRNVLRGKFIVDVKEGYALTQAERARDKELQSKLKEKRE